MKCINKSILSYYDCFSKKSIEGANLFQAFSSNDDEEQVKEFLILIKFHRNEKKIEVTQYYPMFKF